ncbi:anthranilate phosphoribosyltransferase [Malassezia cuniculi]|uniref:Anthranilate phosphoribosyltransferase n=1 Tax=Malassezia cuniculi TaxID=948313 RepID=A0AAF0J735_9BASI|nr:anthranilate phosphoribosyltransferase [Malassezia cuniculi]
MSQQHTLATFKPLVAQLALSAQLPPPRSGTLRPAGPPLNNDQLRTLLQHLADAEFTGNPVHHAAIGAALTALRVTATDMQPDTLAIAQEEFISRATLLELPPVQPQTAGYAGYVDMVGTGGDGKDTFNVSTTASIIAGGVPGMHVCKHGGKASSSSSGSAELLMSLGVPLLEVEPLKLRSVLEKSPFTFLFAPRFHSALAPLAPLRASLGFPTLFNILGPLVNPARPGRGIYGVHSSGLGETYAQALQLTGVERAWVVCGVEGLDEISPAGPTDVWEIADGKITHRQVSPADFGLPTHPLEDVRCGSSAQNAAVVVKMLTEPSAMRDEHLAAPMPVEADDSGAKLEPIPQGVNLGAIYDYTLLQAAALLAIAGHGDLRECTRLARETVENGNAKVSLDTLRQAMRSAQ